jgi:hypothetical protein
VHPDKPVCKAAREKADEGIRSAVAPERHDARGVHDLFDAETCRHGKDSSKDNAETCRYVTNVGLSAGCGGWEPFANCPYDGIVGPWMNRSFEGPRRIILSPQ